MSMAQPRRSNERAKQGQGQHPWLAKPFHQRGPDEVILLLNGERPCWFECWRQREMKQILNKKDVGEPRRCFDCVEHARADKPGRVEVYDDQHKDVDRPNAQSAARMKIVKVFWLVARYQQV